MPDFDRDFGDPGSMPLAKVLFRPGQRSPRPEITSTQTPGATSPRRAGRPPPAEAGSPCGLWLDRLLTYRTLAARHGTPDAHARKAEHRPSGRERFRGILKACSLSFGEAVRRGARVRRLLEHEG